MLNTFPVFMIRNRNTREYDTGADWVLRLVAVGREVVVSASVSVKFDLNFSLLN